MNKIKLMSITAIAATLSLLTATLFTLDDNKLNVLKAEKNDFTINIDMTNAPSFGNGKFQIKTIYGNTIWFEYQNFGIIDDYIALKKNGYLRNLTPLTGIKKFEYTQRHVAILSKMDSSNDVLGAWYDGCQASNINYSHTDNINGLLSGGKWEPSDDILQTTFIKWKDPSCTDIWGHYIRTDNITITYTC